MPSDSLRSDDAAIHLLLSHADGTGVLEDGLPAAAVEAAPAPADPLVRAGDLSDHAADPNDLARQGWAVVAPAGPVGDRLVAALQPLITHRSEQQGRPARILRVPAGLRGAEALDWRFDVVEPEELSPEEVPRYTLLLGDLQQVPRAVQQVLSLGGFPGRLALADTDAVAAYADKVLAWEARDLRQPDLHFYTAHDGSRAVDQGYRQLIQPWMAGSREARAQGRLDARDVGEHGDLFLPEPDELLELARRSEGDVLISLGHGLGAPRGGWSSRAAQRAAQGALVFGSEGILDAAALRAQPFVPGGFWLAFTCFAAGTPSESAYHHWLKLLKKAGGYRGDPEAVLASLPGDGQGGFLARLPQQVLAAQDGPLCVAAPVDLAWSFSFTDAAGRPRGSRFSGISRALLSGARAGVAMGTLTRHFGEANHALTLSYDAAASAAAVGRAHTPDLRQRATLWMQRQDLGGFMLLGDPAVRLGGTAAARAERGSRVAVPSPAGSAPVIHGPAHSEGQGDAGSIPEAGLAEPASSGFRQDGDETAAPVPADGSSPASPPDTPGPAPSGAAPDPVSAALAARLATGEAVEVIEDFDPATGQLLRRRLIFR